MQNPDPQAKLVISAPGQPLREELISHGASIGESPQNFLRLQTPGVADYHLMVTLRDGGFWVLDLGRPEGTSVNGQRLAGERLLEDGDQVLLGGLTQIEFRRLADSTQASESAPPLESQTADKKDVENQTVQAEAGDAARSKVSPTHIFFTVAGSGGLVLLCVLLIGRLIPNPAGDRPHAQSSENARGSQREQSPIQAKPTTGLPPERLRELVLQFAKGIAPNERFAPEFLEAINHRTANYSAETVNAGLASIRAVGADFGALGLPHHLMPVLAMSRSRFQTDTVASDNGEVWQGIWRLPKSLWTFEEEDSEALGVARYIKALSAKLTSPNDDSAVDYMYVIACFGMPWEEVVRADKFFQANVQDYYDFWRMRRVLPPPASDRVVEFFAAGVVGYFPEEFGLSAKSFAESSIGADIVGR